MLLAMTLLGLIGQQQASASITDFAALPKCAVPYVLRAVSQSPCSISDNSCMCASKELANAFRGDIKEACPGKNFNETLKAASNLCRGLSALLATGAQSASSTRSTVSTMVTSSQAMRDDKVVTNAIPHDDQSAASHPASNSLSTTSIKVNGLQIPGVDKIGTGTGTVIRSSQPTTLETHPVSSTESITSLKVTVPQTTGVEKFGTSTGLHVSLFAASTRTRTGLPQMSTTVASKRTETGLENSPKVRARDVAVATVTAAPGSAGFDASAWAYPTSLLTALPTGGVKTAVVPNIVSEAADLRRGRFMQAGVVALAVAIVLCSSF